MLILKIRDDEEQVMRMNNSDAELDCIGVISHRDRTPADSEQWRFTLRGGGGELTSVDMREITDYLHHLNHPPVPMN